MAVTKKLLLPKIIGTGVIGAVMAIGFYVLILDLPEIKTNSSVASTSEIINMNAKPGTSEITEKSESSEENEEENNEINEDSSTSTTTAPNTVPSQNTGTITPTTPTTPTTPSYVYKNDSFSSSKSYVVPGNKTNTLTAVISINNDTVTNITTSSVNDAKSQEYNDDFKNAISGVVVGKKLNGLSVGVVGGASLTSAAFNDILNQIRNLATK